MNQPIALTIDNPVIYITDDPTQNQRTLTFTNQSGSDLKLKGGTPVPETQITPADPTSLYITFGDALTADQLKNMQISAPGWNAAFFSDTFTNWALTPQSDVTLVNGGAITFTLTHITASGQPRPGQITIDYDNFPGIPDSSIQLKIVLENPPVQHQKLKLDVAFLTGNMVYTTLNEGSPIANTLIFSISNPNPTMPIVPSNVPWGANPPVFTISFVYGEAPGYGALTTKKHAADIDLTVAEEFQDIWSISKQVEGDNLYWVLTPQNHEILGTGPAATVEFAVKNIITDFAVGANPDVTLMYIQYANIPNYDDSFIPLNIEKVAGPKIDFFYADPVTTPYQANSGQTTLYWESINTDMATFQAATIPPGQVYAPSGSLAGVNITPGETITMTAQINKGSGLLAGRSRDTNTTISVTQTLRILTPTRTSVDLGVSDLQTMIISPDGKTGFFLQWLSGSVVLVFDLTQNKVITTLDVGSVIENGAQTKNAIYSARLSPNKGVIYTVVQATQTDPNTQNRTVYYFLVTIDIATYAMKQVLNFGNLTNDLITVVGLAVSPDEQKLYFSIRSNDPVGLMTINTDTFEHTELAPWPNDPISLAPFVSAAMTGEKVIAPSLTGIYVVDAAKNFSVVTDFVISTEAWPYIVAVPFIAVSRDRTRIYAVSGCGNTDVCKDEPNYILVIDVDPDTFAIQIAQKLNIGQGVGPLALSPDDKTLYACVNPDQLMVIDTTTLRVETAFCGSNGDYQPAVLAIGSASAVIYGIIKTQLISITLT